MTTSTARHAFWRNTTFLKWAVQVLLVVALTILAFWVYGNFTRQYSTFGDLLSFDVLRSDANVQLGEGFNTHPATGAEALLVGLVNTIKVAATGIVAATVLGLILGISRLSSNWLVAKLGSVYVEAFRNVPLLVQMFFWASAFLLLGKLSDESGPIPGWLYFSNRGLSFATLKPTSNFWQWLVFVSLAVIAGRYVYRLRATRREATGDETRAMTWGIGTFLLIAAVGWVIHPVVGFLGSVLSLAADSVAALPVVVFQGAAGGLFLFLTYRWVRRFLRSTRIGGRVKLDDDSMYRIGFNSVMGMAAAGALFGVPAISRQILRFGGWMLETMSGGFTGASGIPLELSRPDVLAVGQTGSIFAFADTGFFMTPAFVGVWVGVTLYTAAFIGEAVRAGILAVPKGQVEAGLSSGLKRSQLLRLVILPQALPVVIPPVGNQYLNLTKNTSLGLALGYAEIVQVGRVLAADGAALPVISLVWMAFYLAIAVLTSLVLNRYNRRVQLVER